MATPAEQQNETVNEAKASLERMQEFDVLTLTREHEFGTALNFADAVEPATRLVALYSRLASAALQDFPVNKLTELKDVANQDYNLLKQVLEFIPESGNPFDARQQLVNQIFNAYENTFTVLHPLVAYSLHRSADFQRLDRDARSTLQSVQDQGDALKQQLEDQLKEASKIVEEVRDVAAETGVSQQARYFKTEADDHESASEMWRTRTVRLSWLLGCYGVVSLFIAKIPWLAPTDTYQSVQLGVSKVMIFAVISFMLYLSARSYLSHKHNAIVNRHRQNALLTYRALVDASGGAENREVVLTHAAACIYGPQPTGYSQDGGEAPRASSVVEVFGKPIAGG